MSRSRKEVVIFVIESIEDCSLKPINIGLNEQTLLDELKDIDFDSLDMIFLISTIEEEYQIRLENDDIDKVNTIGELVDLICQAF